LACQIPDLDNQTRGQKNPGFIREKKLRMDMEETSWADSLMQSKNPLYRSESGNAQEGVLFWGFQRHQTFIGVC
jgi:hypothetical protein